MSITFKVKDINEEPATIDQFNFKSFLKEYYDKQILESGEYYYYKTKHLNEISREESLKLFEQAKLDREEYQIKRDENINNLVSGITIIDSSFKVNSNIGSTSNNNDIKISRGLKSIKSNSFIFSCWEAYSKHHHLEIRPDDVYMAIMVQFSFYINKHSEALRDRLVDFQGKQSIQVTTNDPILQAQYNELTLQLAEKMKSCIKDPSIASWVIPNFTTTTESDKVAFASVLLSTTKNFFNLLCVSKCGLPSVTLLGTVDDWSNLKERLQKLKEFNIDGNSNDKNHSNKYRHEYDDIVYTKRFNLMDKWLTYLEPVIDQFILTASGNPNLEWWNSIVDYKQRSGGDRISGWLSCFACFTSKGDWIASQMLDSEWLSIPCTHVSNGYVTTPIQLIDSNGIQYNSTLFSGHIGAASNQTKITPLINWFLLLDSSTPILKP